MKWLLVLSLLVSLLSSCTTFEKCQAKFGTGVDSVKVLVPVLQHVPGTKSEVTFSEDLLRALPEGTTISSGETGPGKTKASLTKTAADKFKCAAETQSFVVRDTVEAKCPPVAKFSPEPKIISETPFWNAFLIWFLVAAFLVQSLRLLFKNQNISFSFPGFAGVFRKTAAKQEKPSIPTQQDNGLPS